MKSKQHRVDPGLLIRARELRHSMTHPEVILWPRLRSRQLGGFKFRRQYPIGPYVPDFYCAECRLIVELDGDVHALQPERDRARTAWFYERNYRVILFFNDEVYQNLEGVLEAILLECQRTLTPTLSLEKGEGEN